MKKGCFVKSIIVLTILVAAVLYIVQNHLDAILKPGKKILKNIILSDIENNLVYVKPGEEKDLLKVMLEDYLTKKIESADKISDKDFDWLTDYLKTAVKDSVIDKKELNKIKELIKEEELNERSKKN